MTESEMQEHTGSNAHGFTDAVPVGGRSELEQENDDEKANLEWTGPNDPANPRNWKFPNRLLQTAIPALFGFVRSLFHFWTYSKFELLTDVSSTLATSVIVPAIPAIQLRFHVSREVAILGLSSYTLGLGLGPLLAAPISELFGRRAVYLTTLPLLLAFTAGAGCAQNIATLVVCRLLAGSGGSGVLAVGAGNICPD